MIPTPLRQYVGNSDTIVVDGESVDEVLRKVADTSVQLKRHLFDENGKMRNFVNVYLNEEDIRYLEREKTAVKEGDVISIIPSIAGGSSTLENDFTYEDIQRYSRHLLLPEVGLGGQLKLRKAKVLVIGAGGLGSPLLLYLAAAGVGTLGIVDFDTVDFSNLQRQIIHSQKDVGRKKIDSAEEKIKEINHNIQVVKHETRLTSENALDIIRQYDIVIDGTDNFPTRYLVNDACVLLGKPNVYGSIYRFEGQVSVFDAKRGPCYRCLYENPPPPGLVPSCAEGGVVGVLPGTIGTLQAMEAIKLILGEGEPLIGRLLLFDAMKMRFKELKLRKNPDCPVCGTKPTIHELIDYEQFCGITPERENDENSITAEELAKRLKSGENIVLVDVREPQEWDICRIEGARLIPLNDIPARVNELNTADEIVLYCKVGQRSAYAVNFLKDIGFRKVKNLKGGINAWAEKVDASMPRY
ncbi:MAG: molybdopterin-synthase adenylyltransferase MoeB [Thermoplasmata archaeon]|uniref:Molybdopterin-synthase adenylyltransferase MoeB n=1 Tax=Candidatus Sysuiplasma superficiale TaxID=2823368 RepID=A0A8J7YQJ6_9ARCH|nr:molybdopterin-synthase adenylyltransferase MoeB [Candidatus Sysuiplasma superficiale]MBX8643351.1 molybdopterin-synthase adenylyltransferase MoeB [Candidatus Sysuiplasma superficiale]